MAEGPARLGRLAEDLVSSFRHVASEDPAKAKLRATQSLSALVEELMQKHQIGRPSPEQAIRDEWVAIVGPANATYSHAVRIERGKLWVQASHAVVRNEIFMHREEIVARIRLIPGCSEVKSIRVGPS